MAWPPPLSRRYQEEDAHHSPAVAEHETGMASLSSRLCGKQRLTRGPICSLFAVETELRDKSRLVAVRQFFYRRALRTESIKYFH